MRLGWIALVAACQGPIEDPPGTAQAPADAEDLTVVSDDGLATLVVPRAALDALAIDGTAIAVDALPRDGVGLRADDGLVPPLAAYELTPDGLVLDPPGLLTLTLDAPDASGIALAHLSGEDAATLAPVRSLEVSDAGALTGASVEVAHFSRMFFARVGFQQARRINGIAAVAPTLDGLPTAGAFFDVPDTWTFEGRLSNASDASSITFDEQDRQIRYTLTGAETLTVQGRITAAAGAPFSGGLDEAPASRPVDRGETVAVPTTFTCDDVGEGRVRWQGTSSALLRSEVATADGGWVPRTVDEGSTHWLFTATYGCEDGGGGGGGGTTPGLVPDGQDDAVDCADGATPAVIDRGLDFDHAIPWLVPKPGVDKGELGVEMTMQAPVPSGRPAGTTYAQVNVSLLDPTNGDTTADTIVQRGASVVWQLDLDSGSQTAFWFDGTDWKATASDVEAFTVVGDTVTFRLTLFDVNVQGRQRLDATSDVELRVTTVAASASADACDAVEVDPNARDQPP